MFSGLHDLVAFPWERLLYVLIGAAVLWWLWGKVARCQGEVNTMLNNALYVVNSAPCNEDRDNFKDAIDCDAFHRKLDSTYHEELWWNCFLNTFIFYRSWIGLGAVGLLAYIVLQRTATIAPVAVQQRSRDYSPPRALPQPIYYSESAPMRLLDSRRTRRRSRPIIRPYRSSEDEDDDDYARYSSEDYD